MKSIQITKETWKKLSQAKMDLGARTHEEIILKLWDIATFFEPAIFMKPDLNTTGEKEVKEE